MLSMCFQSFKRKPDVTIKISAGLPKFLCLVDGNMQWDADNLNLKEENLHVGEII